MIPLMLLAALQAAPAPRTAAEMVDDLARPRVLAQLEDTTTSALDTLRTSPTAVTATATADVGVAGVTSTAADSAHTDAAAPEVDVMTARIRASAAAISAWLRPLRRIDARVAGAAAAALFLCIAVPHALRIRIRRRGRAGKPRYAHGPVGAARSLAAAGVSPLEIARTTGMSRDAIDLIVLRRTRRMAVDLAAPGNRFRVGAAADRRR